MKILWLASWYPNPYEPCNGDFVQRHAHAVAAQLPIDVIHILQHGGASQQETIVTEKGGLTEYFHAFAFATTGIGWLDKIRYNLRYHQCFKEVLKSYIAVHGEPDLVHVHVPVKAGLMALYLLKKHNLNYIVSEQSSHYESSSPFYFFKRSKYYQNNCRRIFANALAVTNVSETIGKVLQQLFHIRQYATIHNLVDTARFYYKPHQRSGKIRLIHVSALGEQKNPAGMIRALSLLKQMNDNWQCTICGPAQAGLLALVKEYELENELNFTGEIPYQDVALYMQKSDIFFLFSNHENFPCVVVEALCSGLPVISSIAGGIAEAVNDTNGLLVQPDDEKALADALHKTINNLKNYHPAQIAAKAAEQYNQQKIADQFIHLYKQLLRR